AWGRGEDFLPDYRAWSATLGRPVTVHLGDGAIQGQAADIAGDGRLGVIVDGRFLYFSAADVDHLRPARL
ncbi:MAG: biotin--[acetyl-CoA-carboxylase] ligase, partial [Propionibacteriaceae bacterium]|nr:biotin--[acetyl-CoA-carboxylase] ligase [Propionibacteriaceae bacterium]